jgi:hypothetical protein
MQDLNQLQAYLRQFHSSKNVSMALLPCAYLHKMKSRDARNDDFYAEHIKKAQLGNKQSFIDNIFKGSEVILTPQKILLAYCWWMK